MWLWKCFIRSVHLHGSKDCRIWEINVVQKVQGLKEETHALPLACFYSTLNLWRNYLQSWWPKDFLQRQLNAQTTPKYFLQISITLHSTPFLCYLFICRIHFINYILAFFLISREDLHHYLFVARTSITSHAVSKMLLVAILMKDLIVCSLSKPPPYLHLGKAFISFRA